MVDNKQMVVTKRIAVDLDDVIAGFFPHACEYFDRPEIKCNIWDGIGVNKWIVDGFKDIADDVDFWSTMPIISRPNSIDFDIFCYLTYSPESLINTRKVWLIRHGFPLVDIVSTENKLQSMIDLGIDVLVEDKVSTVNEINNSGTGKMALQFKPPYMTEDCDDRDRIITHLSEVNKKLEELC